MGYCRPVGIDPSLLTEILLHAKSLFGEELSVVDAYKSVMPRFVYYAGVLRLALGIAQYEAVFGSVLGEPRKCLGIFKSVIIHAGVFIGHDVGGKA